LNRDLAFMVSMFPTLFIGLMFTIQYCLSKGLIILGQPTASIDVLFLAFVFGYGTGIFGLILFDHLKQ